MTVSPSSDRLGMFWIVTVGIEPESMSKRCIRAEFDLRHAFDKVDQAAMRVFEFPSNLLQAKTTLLFGHDLIEGVNTAVCNGVSRWLAAFENGGQVLERFLLPGCHMGEDVPHRPISGHTGFHHLGIG